MQVGMITRWTMLTAVIATTAIGHATWAQGTPSPGVPSQEPPSSESFSFDWLKRQMKDKASRPDTPPAPLDTFLENLTYDDYRNIYFRPSAARWADTDLSFQLQAFHPGWLYPDPVQLFEVVDGEATPLIFNTDDYEYRNELAERVPEHAALSGVAGLKVTVPFNSTEKFDELITFLGASYFRALGAGNSYGLSARGLALNTWLNGPEEFPRFSTFWIVRPEQGSDTLEIYAALDSTSVTGAYRFVISPGADTVVEIEMELNFRASVEQLGLVPLTSMFYFAEHSERGFDDYRAQVHDSDALQVIEASGDVLLRPLNNPYRVTNSYFATSESAQFGLLQRDRNYEDYQDAGAQYHKRPSVMIETLGNWGPGAVRLVEIPAELEIDDNIVMFWVPDAAPQAGETRNYHYKMHWGALPPDPSGALAYVYRTGAGVGGASGVPVENPNLRKFVIDFEGGALGDLEPDAKVQPIVTASSGEISGMVLHKIDDAEHRWRLFFDIDGQEAELIELSAHVADEDRKLTETWVYQWLRDPASITEITLEE